ncbi:hypothetical protein [Thiothrix nivea]|uniref:Uncharacterized protein n=1 Tax=Thiothrix nivea (strain ATCC 35100 / DSM 5205 / JP2) TaxID=870187 RepID=A0A656H8Z4_THINJ|nr:hypothetical protein [Thiothrix nivea]EIJ32888.1 hypothetical protein Thini_0226 [Thiothrix nivea DSM 5205]
MKKTYTIQTVTHTVISPGKGSIIWELLDAADDRQRKINGITTLDKDGVIEVARSIYTRESPLVEELLLHNEGDTFTIDFTEFNKAQGYINREIYANMKKCERMACLAQRVGQVLAVAAAVAVLWLGWTLFASVNEFAQQQPLTHHVP